MSEKKPVNLIEDEVKACAEFQKKCIEAFAEIACNYNDEIQFKLFAVGMCLVISNLMATLGIININDFLDELVDNIKRMHETIQNNASYMQFKNGKKISEGKLN